MTPEELDIFLRELTDTEKRFRSQGRQMEEGTEQAELKEAEFFKPWSTIEVVRNERFHPVPPHSHNYIEMSYVWSGTCVQYVEGRKVETRQGDICIMDTDAVHALDYCGEEDIVINLLMKKEYFDSSFFSRMTKSGILPAFLINAVTERKNREHFLKIPTAQNPYVRGLVARILCEYYGDDLGKKEVIDSCMVILFTELLRCFRSASRGEAAEGEQAAALMAVLEYIEKHSQSCSLPEVAERFGFHPVYLTTLLKEKTGRSFLEHVQQQRLLKAKMLLAHTGLSVSEIVAEAGYRNVNFFYRKFRQSEGCTPMEYRRRSGGEEP